METNFLVLSTLVVIALAILAYERNRLLADLSLSASLNEKLVREATELRIEGQSLKDELRAELELATEDYVRQKSSYEDYISTLEYSNKDLLLERSKSSGQVELLRKEVDGLQDENEDLTRNIEELEKEKNEWRNAWENKDYDFCVKSCDFIKYSICSLAKDHLPFGKYYLPC